MDSLKKEIGRKRKQLEENSILVPGKKFFKRGCFTKKEETVEKTDESCLNEILVSNRELKKQNIAGAARNDLRVVADATTYEKIPEVVSTCHIARELSLTYPFLTHAKDLGKGNVDFDIQAISQLLKLLLEIWNQKLRSRSDETKESVQGKRDSADYAQTQRYLKPLFKKLRNKSIQDDILDSLTTIVGHLLDRNYVLANAAYLQLAIGNAPWPIGVTMVGIHVRKGREKISSKNIAHVLNDETQRKYIHGLKRLITKCQSFFPTDPSRCVV